MSERVAQLRARLAQENLPGILLLKPDDVGYLSGFSGSTAALLISPERSIFITDSRYTIQAREECPGFEIAITSGGSGAYDTTIEEQARSLGAAELAVEAEYLTLKRFSQLAEKLQGITLKPVDDLVAPLRWVKDAEEIEAIRAACAIVDQAFEAILPVLRSGITEREAAAELEYRMKKLGSEKAAFDTIVASGWRSALPHARPSDKPLEAGDLVTLDFGARVNGYVSDLTRTVVLGPATERQREVYGVVLEAQLAAIAAVRAGAEGNAVDAVARDIIKARGFGEYFGHGLGHGIGRICHDHQALSQTSTVKLQAGMAVTIEPGVYIEGWGGIRIEDDVLVQETGGEILTHAPKRLIELPV